MYNKKLEFKITKDFFHIKPTKALYEILIKACKQTGSKIHIKISYEFIINASRDESHFELIDHLTRTKRGETIQFTFEPPVSDDYLNNLKERIKDLF